MLYIILTIILIMVSTYFLFLRPNKNKKSEIKSIIININYLKKAYNFFNEKDNYLKVHNYLNELDENDRKIIVIVEDIADRCYELKNLRGSLVLYEKAIEFKKKFEPKNYDGIIKTMNKIIEVYIEMESYSKKLI